MEGQQQRKGIQEVDRTNPPSNDQLPVTCFFPAGATSGLSPPSNNAIITEAHQEAQPLSSSGASSSVPHLWRHHHRHTQS